MNWMIEERLATVESPYQTIEIVRTSSFGKALLLDGHIQLAELDEHAYHESLVHVPMLAMESPGRALVIGGGDGGVVREILKHRSVQHIDLVDIDEAVTQTCLDHFPEVADGAFDSPLVYVHFEDAFPFVRQPLEPYDLIVVDATDVYEEEDGSLSEQLFTERFYQDLHGLLSPGGMIVTQADNPVFCPYSTDWTCELYASIFELSGFYWALVPSFGGYSGFVWGSKATEPSATLPAGAEQLSLRYLDEVTYRLAMSPLPFQAEENN